MSINYEEFFERAKQSTALTSEEKESIRALLENYMHSTDELSVPPAAPVNPKSADTHN